MPLYCTRRTIHIQSWVAEDPLKIGFKDITEFIDPFVTVSVVDAKVGA